MHPSLIYFFFFNDTATTEIYTLSLHDALPIYEIVQHHFYEAAERLNLSDDVAQVLGTSYREITVQVPVTLSDGRTHVDRKSTRLNSSHANISYAVFCLKKKNNL